MSIRSYLLTNNNFTSLIVENRAYRYVYKIGLTSMYISSDITLTTPLPYPLCILLAPFKSLSNKLRALNLNFDNLKTKYPIASYMHRFWNAAGTCISLLWFIKIITNTFMRDCTYHTFCFISICICYITIFKNPLNMLYIFDFVSSKTKHAIACWVLQQINNLYLLRSGTHYTSCFNNIILYILLASFQNPLNVL